jgi:hypothetical protein
MMSAFKFQLVIQFQASTLEQFDFLIELEDLIREGFPPRADAFVDGHDFGMDEFNIFIHTNEPRAVLEQAGEIIEANRHGLPFSAGYRGFSDDEYIPLWPLKLESFSVA